jgi:hypothetical protein
MKYILVIEYGWLYETQTERLDFDTPEELLRKYTEIANKYGNENGRVIVYFCGCLMNAQLEYDIVPVAYAIKHELKIIESGTKQTYTTAK